MARLILFGLGATAQVLHYHLTRAGHEVVALTADAAYLNGESLWGLPVVPFDQVVERYPPAEHAMMIAIGYAGVNQLRAARCEAARRLGYALLSYVSLSATLWEGLVPGEHCKIGENSLFQPFSQLGENVFVGSDCLIGHHARLGDHCFLASRVTLGGGVVVGEFAFLGTGAVVRNGVQIAPRTVVGAGAVLLQDTQAGSVHVAPGAEILPLSSERLWPV